MMGNEQPPGIADPLGRAVWGVLHGSDGPVSKLNEQIDKIRQDAKLLSEMNETVAELNETLKNTNNILREFLDSIK